MNHIFYYDNWFTSVNLLVQLATKETFAIATARSNRLLGCEMQCEKELKQKGRGSFEEKETTIDGFVVRAGLWSRKSHHPIPTPGNFDYPTPTPGRLRPSAVLKVTYLK